VSEFLATSDVGLSLIKAFTRIKQSTLCRDIVKLSKQLPAAPTTDHIGPPAPQRNYPPAAHPSHDTPHKLSKIRGVNFARNAPFADATS